MTWRRLFCGQKWLLLLSPVFLLFLTIFVMTLTLPSPLPPADIDRRSSRALSAAVEFRSRPGSVQFSAAAGLQPPLTGIRHRASSAWKERSDRSAAAKPASNKRSSARESKHKHKGSASKRKELGGAVRVPPSHRRLNPPEFTAPWHRIKSASHIVAANRSAKTYVHPGRSKSTAAHTPGTGIQVPQRGGSWNDGHTLWSANTHIHAITAGANPPEHHQTLGKLRRFPGYSDRVGKEQQVLKVLFRDLQKDPNVSEDAPESKPGSPDPREALSKPETEAATETTDSSWCVGLTEQDLSGPLSDLRRIRIAPHHRRLPWLSEDDVHKMVLLAEGEVLSKSKVPGHGQVLQVALDPPAAQHAPGHSHPQTHSERCQQGHCSLIKRTTDWIEVFAFHLDRVLGLQRSLPAVLRTFHSAVLPYRYLSGTPRPAVWWDPDIQHLADTDNDQNSVPLSWLQYQNLLEARCGSDTDLRSAPCVGIHHSEWGRLALFDFLLQLNDRLDRYCCGFAPDSTELCVENLLHNRCRNTEDLLLVHILVRKADPSRLVFIDNAGRPQQSNDNLNFRLLKGIDQFPERAVSVLQSGCLESLLLHSLYADKEFWDSQGGASGLRPLIHTVDSRGKILLQHIRDRKLQLQKDL